MAINTGATFISGNFELVTRNPLDARTLVDNKTDLDDISNPYMGLIVFIIEENKSYICIDPDEVVANQSLDGNEDILPAVWAQIGSGTEGIGDLSGWVHDETNNEVKLNTITDKVGIGTASPSSKLQIKNTTAYTLGENDYSTDSIGLYGGVANANGSYFGGITWHNDTRRRAGISSVMENTDADFVGLAFFTQGTDGAGDYAESLRITHIGNVGIGTKSPVEALDVVGTVKADAFSAVEGVGADQGYGFHSSSTDYGNHFTGLQYSSGNLIINTYSDAVLNLDTNDNSPNSFIIKGRPDDAGNSSNIVDVFKVEETGDVTITGYEWRGTAGKVKTASLYVVGGSSAVYPAAGRYIYFNGEALTQTGLGLTLTIINGEDLTVDSHTIYNTHGSSNDSTSLANAINAMAWNKIGVLASEDSWELNVNDDLRAAALKVGLTRLGNYRPLPGNSGSGSGTFRQAYAAVFYGAGHSAEITSGADANDGLGTPSDSPPICRSNVIEVIESSGDHLYAPIEDAPLASIITTLAASPITGHPGEYSRWGGSIGGATSTNALYSAGTDFGGPIITVGEEVGASGASPNTGYQEKRVIVTTRLKDVYTQDLSDSNNPLDGMNPTENNLYFKQGANDFQAMIEASRHFKLLAGGTSGQLIFDTNSATRMTIRESGNVGIGTASPTEKLHVNGNVLVSGNITVNGSTSTVNTEELLVDKPIIEMGLVDGSAPSTDLSKDLGSIMHYYDGSAKKAFMGYDESANKFTVLNNASDNSGVITGDVGTLVANIEGNVEDVFAKGATAIKNIPSVGDIAPGGTATMSTKEWIEKLFFPFVSASYSSVTGDTLAELGVPVTSYTLESDFTMDAGDAVTAATASYKLLSSGSWNTPVNILSSVDDSGSGDPLTFDHSHDFTSINVAENSEFAFTFTFQNDGVARVLDGTQGTGPKRTLTFQARSLQGQFSTEFPSTPTALVQKAVSLSSTPLSSFSVSNNTNEYIYYAIPTRFNKYVVAIHQAGVDYIANWELVTNISGTTTPTDTNGTVIPINSSNLASKKITDGLPLYRNNNIDTAIATDYLVYKQKAAVNTGNGTLSFTITLGNIT